PQLRSERTDWGPDLTGLGDVTVDVINFGHEPPLLVSADSVRPLPLREGLPLGLGDLAPRTRGTCTVRLAPDESLLLVTDGVTEARDGSGAFFPLLAYLTGALAADPRVAADLRELLLTSRRQPGACAPACEDAGQRGVIRLVVSDSRKTD
ncbi:PP2C family protein-serine/threonine phosphatase, partial [Streptomyces ipomoeae]|uniref:PP2C family protein-serine/threonine phosphatase n=1 Tax=Streptomyces ipomoeae TaxID=103232 RepID=UPI00066292F9